MNFNIFTLFLVLLVGGLNANDAPPDDIKSLQSGNDRFIKMWQKQDELRESLAQTQQPFACIVNCSDSRVPPEVIFDQKKGDLFVIRNAGNIIGETEKESISYAVNVLKTPLIVVIGHQNCGAVKAVLNKNTKLIPEIAQLIESALPKGKELSVKEAIIANVRHGLSILYENPQYQKLIHNGKLTLAGGYYNIEKGSVDFFEIIDSTTHQP